MNVWALKNGDQVLCIFKTQVLAEDLKDWYDAQTEDAARNYWKRHKLTEENYGSFSGLVEALSGEGFSVEEFKVIENVQ